MRMISPTTHQAFMAWCTAQGIKSPLELRETSTKGMWGTVAATNKEFIADNNNNKNAAAASSPALTKLLSIPLSACLLGDSHAALADRLVYEQGLGEDSWWAPYLNMLPTLEDLEGQQQLPRFWKASQLSQCSNADQGWVEESLVNIRSGAEKELEDPWAIACIRSRANYLQSADTTRQLSLTPWLDMMNHDCTVPTKARIDDEKDDTFILTAKVKATVKPGDEVCISYGDLTNLETLVDYGFCVPDNPCNKEYIDVRIIRQVTPFRITVPANGCIDTTASLAPLRQALASTRETQNALRRQQQSNQGLLSSLDENSLVPFLQPLSIRNEMEVYGVLSATLYNAVEQAQDGAAATDNIALIRTYLTERAKTLQKAQVQIDEELDKQYDTWKYRFTDL